MTGLAASPGTEVLPTCSMPTTGMPAKASRVQIVQRLELPWPTRVVWGHLDHPRTSPLVRHRGASRSGASTLALMPGRDPGNDLVAARFSLTIDGVEIAQFAELVGMVSEADPDTLTERLLEEAPGKRKPPTLTLRRGMTKDLGIFAWHESVVGADPATARKNATLVVYNTAGTAIARFELANAWPSKIEISAEGGSERGALRNE